MTAADRYLTELSALVERMAAGGRDVIERAAALAADSVADGGVVHVFGSGHSQLAALEGRVRAGGLACVNVIADTGLSPQQPRRAGLLERLSGYGEVLADTTDLRPGELVVVVSNSGINAVPVEFAAACVERGLTVLAIVSRAHAAAVSSRAPSGRKLDEIAHLVLDTHAPAGDAVVEIGDVAAGGVSTVLAAAALTALLVRVAERLADAGVAPPVLGSQNFGGAGDRNDDLLARYAARTGMP